MARCYLRLRGVCLIGFFSTLLTSGCYSFSAGAIPIHLKSIFVPTFSDQSRSPVPLLKEKLTQLLIERIGSSTPLTVIQYPTAHSKLEGSIVNFSEVPGTLDPVTQLATSNKLTISVKATFSDNIKSKPIYSQQFDNSLEYPVNNLNARTEAMSKVLEYVSQSIVEKMSSNW